MSCFQSPVTLIFLYWKYSLKGLPVLVLPLSSVSWLLHTCYFKTYFKQEILRLPEVSLLLKASEEAGEMVESEIGNQEKW